MTENIFNQMAVTGPLIQVVLPDEQERIFPLSDIVQDGEDPVTLADATIIERTAQHIEDQSICTGYVVTRPGTGNVLISRKAVFGN